MTRASTRRRQRKQLVVIVCLSVVALGVGALAWRLRGATACAKGDVRLAYATTDGRAFVVRACGNRDRLALVDPARGVVWSVRLPGVYWGPLPGIDAPLATHDAGIFTIRVRKTRAQGPVFHVGYDARTGNQLWRTEPVAWRAKIGSFTASFEDVVLDGYWQNKEPHHFQIAYDRKTGERLWTAEIPLSSKSRFQTPSLFVFEQGDWNILQPRTGKILRTISARDAAYVAGSIYYLAADGIHSLDPERLTSKLVAPGAYRYNEHFTAGSTSDGPLFVLLREWQEDAASEATKARVFTLPEDLDVYSTVILRRDVTLRWDRGLPLYGKLTRFVPVMARSPGSSSTHRLVMLDLTRRAIAWRSRTFRSPTIPRVLTYQDHYLVIWDEGYEEDEARWILLLDGNTGALRKAVAAPFSLVVSPHSLGGDRVWLRKRFSDPGLAVLDLHDLSVVLETDPSWTFPDVTERARKDGGFAAK